MPPLHWWIISCASVPRGAVAPGFGVPAAAASMKERGRAVPPLGPFGMKRMKTR
jgi:hypothetical protein